MSSPQGRQAEACQSAKVPNRPFARPAANSLSPPSWPLLLAYRTAAYGHRGGGLERLRRAPVADLVGADVDRWHWGAGL